MSNVAREWRIAPWLLAAPFLWGCESDDTSSPPESVSFAQVQSTLQSDCGGCHDGGSGRIFQVTMDSSQLLESGMLNPADPAQSLLILKPINAVSHGGGEVASYSVEDRDLVQSWIGLLPPAPPKTLRAARVGTGTGIPSPNIDGFNDLSWSGAPSSTYLIGGGWGEAQSVTMKALYDDAYLYLLVSWDDDKLSDRRQPWVKQTDSTWQILPAKSPTPPDGSTWQAYMSAGFNEENAAFFNYEDKLAVMWNTYGASTVAGFEESGCAVTCHDPTQGGRPGTVYNYTTQHLGSKKYTNALTEIADLWHWKSVRNNQHYKSDDQFVRYWVPGSTGSADGGRASDSGASGYAANPALNGRPMYRGSATSSPPYYIFDDQKVELTDQEIAAFPAGWEIPNMITSGPTGFRADLDARGAYNPSARRWTIEFRRLLVTGDVTDVQFQDLAATYSFGVAVFDNAQIEHSYMISVGKLSFIP